MSPLTNAFSLLLLVAAAKTHTKMSSASLSSSDLYASPCPGIFNYFVRDNALQYGVVRVQCPNEDEDSGGGCTELQLHVELSVGNDVQGYNGELALFYGKEQALQEIMTMHVATYKVLFPRWYNYPPKVTRIAVNGRLICSGDAIDINLVRVLTTIKLHHTLKLSVPFGAIPNLRPSATQIDFNPQPPAFIVPQISQASEATPQRKPAISSTNNFGSNVRPAGNRPLGNSPLGNSPLGNVPANNRPIDNDNRPIAAEFPEEDPQVPQTPTTSANINSDECGISFNTNTLIANGKNVAQGQYPWLVAIFVIKSLGPEFLCGGTLISNRHVLTAGHCLRTGNRDVEREKVFVRIGEHNIHQWTSSGSRSVGVAKLTVHNDYKLMSADGDVALVRLADPVVYGKFVKPICLWNEDTDLNSIVGSVGTVVGWGKDERLQLITPEPKQVRFPVVSQEDCLRSHFTFREITSKRTFCAGYRNGSGPCNGDSGGGFALERNSRWTLRGIVSMSIAKDRTCDFSQYFVFADVSKYRQWIFDNL